MSVHMINSKNKTKTKFVVRAIISAHRQPTEANQKYHSALCTIISSNSFSFKNFPFFFLSFSFYFNFLLRDSDNYKTFITLL